MREGGAQTRTDLVVTDIVIGSIGCLLSSGQFEVHLQRMNHGRDIILP